MLNKEIGDNELYLNNRTLACQASFLVSDNIQVNVNNPNYNYGSGFNSGNELKSVYSKENPFVIEPSALAILVTNTGNVNYQPPFTGPYSTPIVNSLLYCCDNYYLFKQQDNNGDKEIKDVLTENEMTLFPNPTTGQLVVRFTSHSEDDLLIIKVYDLTGRMVWADKHEVKSSINSFYFYPLQLPNSLTLGNYIMQITYNNTTHNLKFIKQ